MTDVDLFGGALPEAPPVPPAVFHDKVQWRRLHTLKKPQCGHCTMLAHYAVPVSARRATWTRVGVDGSVLDLCEDHMVDQARRDSTAADVARDAAAYEVLRQGVLATMADPADWDDGQRSEVEILVAYVQWLSLKIHDIGLVMTRDWDYPPRTTAVVP